MPGAVPCARLSGRSAGGDRSPEHAFSLSWRGLCLHNTIAQNSGSFQILLLREKDAFSPRALTGSGRLESLHCTVLLKTKLSEKTNHVSHVSRPADHMTLHVQRTQGLQLLPPKPHLWRPGLGASRGRPHAGPHRAPHLPRGIQQCPEKTLEVGDGVSYVQAASGRLSEGLAWGPGYSRVTLT